MKVIRKTVVAAVSLGGIGFLGISAVLWLGADDPRLAWRREIIALKLLGTLPGESVASIFERIRPLVIGSPTLFRGMRLDAANAYGADTEIGTGLFRRHCEDCHGSRGEAGDADVDFSDKEVQAKLSDLDIYMALTRGIKGTNMPPSQVTVTEGVQLTAYVRSLRSNSRPNEHPSAAVADADCEPCKDIQVSTRDVISSASRGEWLSFSGDFTGQRFSPLEEINKVNVSRLRPRFVYQLESIIGLQATPLVANGVMFVTGLENEVVAIDLATGDAFWTYQRAVPAGLALCCGRPNRGVALLGDRVFHGTLDAHLIALDVRTGREIWNVAVADTREGYTMTGAPLAIDDAIVVGVGGGDFGARGFIDGYEPETGRRLWRFETIPGPGQPGHETWKNDGWKTGGGATWVTGTYDRDLGLVYWGVGNPAPSFNPSARPGDNLYTSSVVAIDAKNGALRWHYQFTPNDGNDWDACQVPVLVDAEYEGRSRKLMLFAQRNCFFYVLDRETGEFLGAWPLCEQSWNEGFTSEGRPIRRPSSISSAGGPLVSPGVAGGPNWPPPSYSALTNLLYVKNQVVAERIFSEQREFVKGTLFPGGYAIGPEKRGVNLTAINALTGNVAWERVLDDTTGDLAASGVLTTASGLVFTGDSQGRLLVLDASSGDEVWNYRLGGEIAMAPITYSYNGSQEVAVISGGSLFVLGVVD